MDVLIIGFVLFRATSAIWILYIGINVRFGNYEEVENIPKILKLLFNHIMRQDAQSAVLRSV